MKLAQRFFVSCLTLIATQTVVAMEQHAAEDSFELCSIVRQAIETPVVAVRDFDQLMATANNKAHDLFVCFETKHLQKQKAQKGRPSRMQEKPSRRLRNIYQDIFAAKEMALDYINNEFGSYAALIERISSIDPRKIGTDSALAKALRFKRFVDMLSKWLDENPLEG
jgi:hypothetical protein